MFRDSKPLRVSPEKARYEMRAAMPWSEKDCCIYKKVFPQMTNWLPKEEATQWRLEFETELAWLLAA
jgi:hypothetical protein